MKILTFLTLISVQGHDDIEILSGDGNDVSEDTYRFGLILSVLHEILLPILFGISTKSRSQPDSFTTFELNAFSGCIRTTPMDSQGRTTNFRPLNTKVKPSVLQRSTRST